MSILADLQSALERKKAEAEIRRKVDEDEIAAIQAQMEAAAMDTVVVDDGGRSRIRRSALGMVLARGQYLADGTNDYRVAGYFGTTEAVRINISGMADDFADDLTLRIVDAVCDAVRAHRKGTNTEPKPDLGKETAAPEQKSWAADAARRILEPVGFGPKDSTLKGPKTFPYNFDFHTRFERWVAEVGKPSAISKLGVSRGSVDNWLKGKPPCVDYVDRIAKATGIDREVVAAVARPSGRGSGVYAKGR